MTNHWVDIKNANLVVVMGGNAAEAHSIPVESQRLTVTPSAFCAT